MSEEKKRITVRVSGRLASRCHEFADYSQMSLNEWICNVLDKEVEETERIMARINKK